MASFEISLDGNGHTALAGHVKVVCITDVIQFEVKVIAYLLCDEIPYFFLFTQ